MKYDNLTLVRPLIGQSSSTRASDWTDEHWSAAFPWVSHELLFTDVRYLVAILRLSGLIARNYRTLALVRCDDILITRLRLQQSESAPAQATQAVVTPRRGISLLTPEFTALEGADTWVRAFFVPIKYAGSVSNPAFSHRIFWEWQEDSCSVKRGRKIENKKQLESTN